MNETLENFESSNSVIKNTSDFGKRYRKLYSYYNCRSLNFDSVICYLNFHGQKKDHDH